VSNTDTQTSLRVKSVAVGRIYAMHAMQLNNRLISALHIVK